MQSLSIAQQTATQQTPSQQAQTLPATTAFMRRMHGAAAAPVNNSPEILSYREAQAKTTAATTHTVLATPQQQGNTTGQPLQPSTKTNKHHPRCKHAHHDHAHTAAAAVKV